MTSDQGSLKSGSGTSPEQVPEKAKEAKEVKVPKETYTYRLDDLEYVERKSWKYRTKKKFKCLVGDHYAIYAIWDQASEVSDANSLITLELGADNQEDTDKNVYRRQRRVRKIVIKKGYAWDGASGPTFDTYGSLQPSLIHDALYQCIRLGYVTEASRKEVDRLFLHMLERGGMGWLRRRIWHRAVRLLGRRAAKPKPHKGHKYPGVVVLTLGIAGLGCWLVFKRQVQVA